MLAGNLGQVGIHPGLFIVFQALQKLNALLKKSSQALEDAFVSVPGLDNKCQSIVALASWSEYLLAVSKANFTPGLCHKHTFDAPFATIPPTVCMHCRVRLKMFLTVLYFSDAFLSLD
jgi:hypothetical protein